MSLFLDTQWQAHHCKQPVGHLIAHVFRHLRKAGCERVGVTTTHLGTFTFTITITTRVDHTHYHPITTVYCQLVPASSHPIVCYCWSQAVIGVIPPLPIQPTALVARTIRRRRNLLQLFIPR